MLTILSFGPENIVKFINAGGGDMNEVGNSANFIMSDTSFVGGDVLRTEEGIIDGGDLTPLYQSARFGNFSYQFDNLPPGDYLVDLHFAEITNTNGPKGTRVFDVFMQEEKARNFFQKLILNHFVSILNLKLILS